MALNDEIASLAAAEEHAGLAGHRRGPVLGLQHVRHNYDQIHPNDAGEAIIAQRWAEALGPRILSYCGQ